ncbi:MAG: ribonuclease HI family protein [Thermomicrobiales bacterium]
MERSPHPDPFHHPTRHPHRAGDNLRPCAVAAHLQGVIAIMPSSANASGVRAFEIVFDGGSLGNPGKGYGSFEITSGGEVICHQREEYGNNITNNQAEYMTLIKALEWLDQFVEGQRATAKVHINGDSQLVINQVTGKWKIKAEQLRPYTERIRSLMSGYRSATIAWHARANSVKRLGH